jgi:phosphomannomutase
MSMQLEINPAIFREYDIRGIAENDLSPEFAECLGLAYELTPIGRTPKFVVNTQTTRVQYDETVHKRI